jgi:hypothetical protein
MANRAPFEPDADLSAETFGDERDDVWVIDSLETISFS